MKRINIKSLLQAQSSLEAGLFKDFLRHYSIEIKDAEIKDLGSLIDTLEGCLCDIGTLSNFYLGYKIPQIGKEFDLLRFGQEYIINIEIKSSCSEEKILNQLIRNKYYLSFIQKQIYNFTFVSESKTLYILQDDENLQKIEPERLLKLLENQKIDDIVVLDEIFNPSDYLVSPFNSTKKFLAGEYFLTHQQEEIKNKFIDSVDKWNISKFISIVGGAGTGKTLLTYDIAKHLMKENIKHLIIHCGQLNNGHSELKENGWTIISIKYYKQHDLSNYDLIIIDETQRIYSSHLDDIIEKINLTKCFCIFSHDKRQTLSTWEENNNISGKISSLSQITHYKLSDKIRTNKETSIFIKMLFNNKIFISISNTRNIEINYFKSIEEARRYLNTLDEDHWIVLRFTPSQYNSEHHEKYSDIHTRTSHEIIGQEFDCVAVVIDQFFTYREDGDLIYRVSAYYDPVRMLFQNMSRSRKKLNLVIINNPEILSRCISILK